MRPTIILAALLAPVPAMAADWRLAAESDRAVSFLDLGSVTRDGGNAGFSRWMVLARPMAARADNVRDSFTADCASGRYQVTRAEQFEGDRAAGRLPASAGTAEPGSVLASLLDIACGRRKAAGAAVSDPLAAGKARLAGGGR